MQVCMYIDLYVYKYECIQVCMYTGMYVQKDVMDAITYRPMNVHIQPIADRVTQNLQIISKTFSKNQRIFDEYRVIHDESLENLEGLVLN